MKKEKHKNIPTLLIDRAMENARDCRKEIQALKDDLRKNPTRELYNQLLAFAYQQLVIYENDIREMRSFYGKKNVIP